MECEVCGKKLRVHNEYGLTVGLDSCEHWQFCGDVYPDLWSDDEQTELEIEEKVGLVILESREQGGYYMWRMTPKHPEYNKRCDEFERRAKEEGLEI